MRKNTKFSILLISLFLYLNICHIVLRVIDLSLEQLERRGREGLVNILIQKTNIEKEKII